MLKLLENIVGLAKSIYENNLVADIQVRKALKKEKIDWQKAKADRKEYREKFKLIKIYKRHMWKQQGIKFGLLRGHPGYLDKGETFGEVYQDAKKWLES